MKQSIQQPRRHVIRRMKRRLKKTKDIHYYRRLQSILLLIEGYTVSEVSRMMQAARSSIQKWRGRFEQLGESGLIACRTGRPATMDTELLGARLVELIEQKPSDYGYLPSRWTSEMLARQLNEEQGTAIHPSTIRRLLKKMGIRWKRARPTLMITDPQKKPKMQAIKKALSQASSQSPVFYIDEVDINFNPRMGNCWSRKGQQTAIPTPGNNQKRYLAGALNAVTGEITWVEWEKKNTELFLLLMGKLRRCYRKARTITLIADNYIIHKNAATHLFLNHNPKFKLLFQPVYHPWVNKIEQVWKQLHDNITRNHKYNTMKQLMKAVRKFMYVVSPFPGANASTAKF